MDITQVGLQTLRQRMAVIPQNPLLMEGSIRFNLDPFGEHSGDKLLEILQLLGLPAGITLETTLGGGGRVQELSLDGRPLQAQPSHKPRPLPQSCTPAHFRASLPPRPQRAIRLSHQVLESPAGSPLYGVCVVSRQAQQAP